MASVAAARSLAALGVQGDKEGHRAVAQVIMGAPFHLSGSHGQHRATNPSFQDLPIIFVRDHRRQSVFQLPSPSSIWVADPEDTSSATLLLQTSATPHQTKARARPFARVPYGEKDDTLFLANVVFPHRVCCSSDKDDAVAVVLPPDSSYTTLQDSTNRKYRTSYSDAKVSGTPGVNEF